MLAGKGRVMILLTLKVLEDELEIVGVEGDRGNPPRSVARRLRVTDRGWMVP